MDIFSLIAGQGGIDPMAAMAMLGRKRGGPLADNSTGPFAPPAPGPLGGNTGIAPAQRPPASPMMLDGPLAMTGQAGAPTALPTSAPTLPAKRGVFDRIGDFMGSDEGKAALLRAGAATMEGGLGKGVMAGADFVDGRRKQRFDQEREAREFGQRDRQLDISQQSTDQSGLYQAGQLQNSANQNLIDMMEAQESARRNAAREGIDWAKLSQDEQQFRVTAALRQVEEQGRLQRHATPSGSTVYAQGQANYRHSTPSASAVVRQQQGPLGSVVLAQDGTPAVDGWFSDTPATPDSRTTFQLQRLPASREQLIPGAVYGTANGPAKWNGREFEAVQ